jgi:hypothetical protein
LFQVHLWTLKRNFPNLVQGLRQAISCGSHVFGLLPFSF